MKRVRLKRSLAKLTDEELLRLSPKLPKPKTGLESRLPA